MVADCASGGDVPEELFDSFERGEVGDAVAEDLLARQAESFDLAVVDAEVAELDGVEEGEADGCGAIDGLELGALAFRLLLPLLQGFGEGLSIVDVGVDAEPVEDHSCLVADGLGADPPPASASIAGADHAGLDVVVLPGC